MSTSNGAPRPGATAAGTPQLPESVEIFDTTLRDGAQFEGISLTVDDKLRVAEQLDWLGVRWIEGGYPQANPRDEEFFRRAPTELDLSTAELVAFGSTRRPAGKVDVDPTLSALVGAGTGTVCIVGKSWDFHVTEALRTTLDEGVAMVGESVRFLADAGLRVFFDAEHFFDGYKANPEYALRVLEAAAVNGAACVVLCDTNGGSLPHEVQHITTQITSHLGADVAVGIHTQNDSGCAVANSVAAVLGGATQVQGTINGYGERTGNANLMTVIPDLTLKLGVATLPEGRMERLTLVSHRVAELVNLPPQPSDPFVGVSAFAHKGGLHTSALGRAGGATYEHVDPSVVGNHTRVLVSDLGGRAGMSMKAAEFGLELDDRAAGALSEDLKRLESVGWTFEAADASLELLMRRAAGWEQSFFQVEAYRVSSYHREGPVMPSGEVEVTVEATVKLWIDGHRVAAVGEGNGPVNALDAAVRRALNGRFPVLDRIHLTDFKVRVVDGGAATGAVVRVLVDSTDGERVWTTVGVDSNVIEASWQALMDSIQYGLLHGSD
ncbi:citramalate synthase [Rhabdothermincola salaria]|uniref:citramalate synthase n=1 Tax=Rhabdothermincola salaria TaxID=2903142 RepID=UPI001E2BBFF3|nr:citramalate synthase [Rhabdothermincola salaria]MCD9623683.1 citramalate synthase [Rhabdothermincola salaria]